MTQRPNETNSAYIMRLIHEAEAAHEAQSGADRLWGWFSLSRASFCVMARVMMHAMPDDWQRRMAILLEEFDDTFPNQPDLRPYVMARGRDNKWTRWPEWLLMYRHPQKRLIDACRNDLTSFTRGADLSAD